MPLYTAIVLLPGKATCKAVGPTSVDPYMLGGKRTRDAYPEAEAVLVVPWHQRHLSRETALRRVEQERQERARLEQQREQEERAGLR